MAGLIARMGFCPGPEKWLKTADEHNPHGYYECLPLMRITKGIMERFGGHIVKNIPLLKPGWCSELSEDKFRIKTLVENNGIEIFKDPNLIVLADLFDELFPEAKWVVIHRDIHETYRSRFGLPKTFQEWERLTAKRLDRWQGSRPFHRALNLDYNDFFVDLEGTILRIGKFLDIELDDARVASCAGFFKPGRK